MRSDAGTSFVELIIMLAIAGILCAGAALCLTRWSMDADTMQAQVEMERITEEMDRYLLVPGRTPPRLVRELPGFQENEPVDPWGTPYALQLAPGRIVSHGPDRRLDTTDPLRGPLGDDLVRVLPRPPRLPPVERPPRPPTEDLLRKIPRISRGGLDLIDPQKRGSSTTDAMPDHQHVEAPVRGRRRYWAKIPVSWWTQVTVGAWSCAWEKRSGRNADLQLVFEGQLCQERRLETRDGCQLYLWDVHAGLVNRRGTFQMSIGRLGEPDGPERELHPSTIFMGDCQRWDVGVQLVRQCYPDRR
jgi:hypothetical protein